MQRSYHLLGWGYVAICCALLIARGGASSTAATQLSAHSVASTASAASGAEWFRRIRPYCNPVEISVVAKQSRPPSGVDGAGYEAACFALAGRTDESRRIIDRLSPPKRYRAAGIVFEVGHPVADAGDDRSAGAIMELVIDYWPNHYMALYHAGMAEYMLGQRDLARKNLEQFLVAYRVDDGWRSNAIEVLNRLKRAGPGTEDLRRPREPGA